MKKLSKFLTAVFAVFLTVCTFTACQSSGYTSGGSVAGTSDINVDNPIYRFYTEDDYDNNMATILENVETDNSANLTKLDVDQKYYLFIRFYVTATQDNDGTSLLSVGITFDALDVMKGTVQEVGSSKIAEMQFTNANTGSVGKTTTISFKIPDKAANQKKVDVWVQLTPVKAGESHIYIDFSFDDAGLKGTDGATKNLEISRVKLATPVVSLDETTKTISWAHVKNADYYYFYESGESDPLIDEVTGDKIIYEPNGISAGGICTFNIGKYISGLHTIVMRAYSDNASIDASDPSTAVIATW